MRPLIGIPPCLDERGRWRPGREYQYLDAAYARAVADAGGVPVYLPLHADVEQLLPRIDGLLLPGGGDLPPEIPYPAPVGFDPVPPPQLAFDRQLLGSALAGDLPVLAICYGMQLLALHCGARLYYDLATDLPEAKPHRLPEPHGRHGLRVEAGTRLALALGDAEPVVNSLHHQGVAEAAAPLRVSARADDGLIEAIEHVQQRFCVGVQWHPEKLQGPHRERLFGAFVAACAGV